MTLQYGLRPIFATYIAYNFNVNLFNSRLLLGLFFFCNIILVVIICHGNAECHLAIFLREEGRGVFLKIIAADHRVTMNTISCDLHHNRSRIGTLFIDRRMESPKFDNMPAKNAWRMTVETLLSALGIDFIYMKDTIYDGLSSQ